ncbi:ABC transporter permease [Nocardioides carbamazepini]|uniref:ABC transporter permease n=1 Tax=Nocardioides carbamazepini TaxID=2854259 RepID=UPI00214A0C1A|nr:ABC transporter permease [Nocardioides carbamazepini]MCR1783992.1 ABC transporter permease [Nocardioides carbamazepini]
MGIFDVAFLVSVLTIAAPVLLAATGELVSQRAGVMNVGLEGIMLAGAFSAYAAMTVTESLLIGFLGGITGGLVGAVLMGALVIEAKVDQIVAGIAIGVLGYGVTAFLDQRLLPEPHTFEPLERLAIPGLSAIPVLGDVVFRQDLFLYATLLIVAGTAFALYRTTWGINLAAVGETPVAADAAGVSVRGVRWAAVLVSGAMAGAAGAYVSVGDVGVFREDMTGGRGYLAIAAVLFGMWRLRGVVLAVTIFACTDAVQLRLQSIDAIPREVWLVAALLLVPVVVRALASVRSVRGGPLHAALRPGPAGGVLIVLLLAVFAVRPPDMSLPASLWLAMPYVLALVALAAAGASRHQAPSALTIPYVRSEA